MYWSVRNKFYFSNKFGWVLFVGNSLSIVLLSQELYEQMKHAASSDDFSAIDDTLLMQLTRMNAIHEVTNQDFDNMILKKVENLQNSNRYLVLTLAVTSACNFKCTYCIEGKSILDLAYSYTDETIENIVKYFIDNKPKEYVWIIWYGGEPLLEINSIEKIINSIKLQNIKFFQTCITNGFLLDRDVIMYLLDNNLKSIQITIDGDKDTHNQRRSHREDIDSYSAIINNLEILAKEIMIRKSNVIVNIRVNIDKENINSFNTVKERCKIFGDNFYVYPGFVQMSPS